MSASTVKTGYVPGGRFLDDGDGPVDLHDPVDLLDPSYAPRLRGNSDPPRPAIAATCGTDASLRRCLLRGPR